MFSIHVGDWVNELRFGGEYVLTFRVYKRFYSRMQSREKLYELRRASPYWNTRLGRARRTLDMKGTVKAVVLCGRGQREIFDVDHITLYTGNARPEGYPADELSTVAPPTGGMWAFWRVSLR